MNRTFSKYFWQISIHDVDGCVECVSVKSQFWANGHDPIHKHSSDHRCDFCGFIDVLRHIAESLTLEKVRQVVFLLRKGMEDRLHNVHWWDIVHFVRLGTWGHHALSLVVVALYRALLLKRYTIGKGIFIQFLIRLLIHSCLFVSSRFGSCWNPCCLTGMWVGFVMEQEL